MHNELELEFSNQKLANGYELVDGAAMHVEHGDQFQVPPDVLKRHIRPGHFVEVRIDSPRFSVHEDDAEHCSCPSCNGPMSKPILSHNEPATLMPLPAQDVPSRGWGEDFWIQITERSGQWLKGTVDNPLVETRLHRLNSGDSIVIQECHMLTIHRSHRADLVMGMNPDEVKELAVWLGTQRAD